MKKIILILCLSLILFTGCNGKDNEKTDALKFKEEYEALNGVENENNGKKYRKVHVSDDNPFVYKEASDIVKMINNKESFIVYFGFAKCPWCRSIISNLIEVAKDYNIDTIYYVDVYDIRDVLKLDDNNEVVTDKEGSKGYQDLIKLLDDVLSDYELTDSDGNKVSTGEKRIYAPNVVSIINGKALKLETGISDDQTDGYQELTEEMLDESYEKLESVIQELKNSNECLVDSLCYY